MDQQGLRFSEWNPQLHSCIKSKILLCQYSGHGLFIYSPLLSNYKASEPKQILTDIIILLDDGAKPKMDDVSVPPRKHCSILTTIQHFPWSSLSKPTTRKKGAFEQGGYKLTTILWHQVNAHLTGKMSHQEKRNKAQEKRDEKAEPTSIYIKLLFR